MFFQLEIYRAFTAQLPRDYNILFAAKLPRLSPSFAEKVLICREFTAPIAGNIAAPVTATITAPIAGPIAGTITVLITAFIAGCYLPRS